MKKCSECKCVMHKRVCKSNAGYYIGYQCDNCGPYERLSIYYSSFELASLALNNNTWVDYYD